MALQQNVYENGGWVTRTLTPQELFREARKPKEKQRKQPLTPRSYGILNKTVIDSPVIRWVLPVQIRSPRNNDVAFIGDSFVQICELGGDYQLKEVIRKQDFGSRIRNARVIGLSRDYPGGHDSTDKLKVKSKRDLDDDIDMSDSSITHDQFPPQLLALVLEHGDLVFLYVTEGPTGELEFRSAKQEIEVARIRLPGFHMVVDPNSRYLTLACSEKLFLVYELESMETLRDLHSRGEPFKPVKSWKARAVRGTIYRIEYLYPNPDNERHIILMLIIIQKGVSRLATYEWELGDQLKDAFKEEKHGHRLDVQWSMPLLVIPLTIQNGFFLVTESQMGCCLDILHGQIKIEAINIGEQPEPTEQHRGKHTPLWTAWSRPWRIAAYYREKDVIYLAREDGIIKFLEYDDSGLDTDLGMGSVDCNLDTAFACLYHAYGDVLITGGDSGPGAIWNIEAREVPKRIGTIPNWSPTVEFVTTSTRANRKSSKGKERADARGDLPLQPDRIFACSGCGNGSIIEFRYGLEAKVGMELDNELPIRQCWALPAAGPNFQESFHLLLALPNTSVILLVSGDLSTGSDLPQEIVPYDLSSSTLAAADLGGVVVQVTTSSVTIILSPTESTRYLSHELSAGLSPVITHAAVRDDAIAVALHTGAQYGLRTLTVDRLNISYGLLFEVEGEVTCVALGKFAGNVTLIAGLWKADGPTLAFYPRGDLQETSPLPPVILDLSKEPANETSESTAFLEAITSIVIIDEQPGEISLVVGTRTGYVLTLVVDATAPHDYRAHCDRLGPSAADVFPLSTGFGTGSVLVCCNSTVAAMTGFSARRQYRFEEIFRVWATDDDTSQMPAPAFHSVAPMHCNLENNGNSSLLMIAGTTIYVAELQPKPKQVPRYMNVQGTPTKIMYSRTLEALVIILVSKDMRPSLHFLDPDTGLDLSYPTNKGQEVEYITGLGEVDTKVLSLMNWRYQKGGNTWEYIVISTVNEKKESNLLVITAERGDPVGNPDGPPTVRFFTKWKRRHDEPIWSIATEAQGLFLCSGNTILYETLDEERKLRKAKEHELSSPAAWMEVVDGRLYVATARHSLEILDYKTSSADDSMARLYTDTETKESLHFIEIGNFANRDDYQSVTLLSDLACGVYGMWAVPHDGRFFLIFQAELQVSIKRFTRGHTRPPWDLFGRRLQYGAMKSSADRSEIIGIGIEGSLHHFTLLDLDAWRLLRFIQNIALVSTSICPFKPTYRTPTDKYVLGREEDEDEDDDDDEEEEEEEEWNPEPQMLPRLNMHVDGDILQRCLSQHALEELISQPELITRFRQLLEALDGGLYTQSLQDLSGYFELCYDVLKYYLAPVL
ncbi:thermotolerance protein [Pseudomassariella vexata]|uniref:Thermotolerance protein n=1 Tax=Pseudomassariella vexata TaxID=1141098 RepID=A0A1Y2E0L3_9PEZI|nr:thermotolerance protein [Pseudomassariella vexata]ORY64894.1 thermotolerance protein [Pseudomassariella vexata]